MFGIEEAGGWILVGVGWRLLRGPEVEGYGDWGEGGLGRSVWA